MIVWNDIEHLTKSYKNGIKKIDGLNENEKFNKLKQIAVKINFILIHQMMNMVEMKNTQLDHFILNMIRALKS